MGDIAKAFALAPHGPGMIDYPEPGTARAANWLFLENR
jgi:hypothetical protein